MSELKPEAAAERFQPAFNRLRDAVGQVVVGQHETVDHLLIGLFSNGHCLLVGVPGLAKTLLIRTLADCLDLSFNRIQFTPDLMPGDITGTEVLEDDPETGRKRFTFIKGPLFAQVVLADEINRTPPKTQAALLEAMQERQVTAGGHRYQLADPFFVLATQNPIEQEGTYPLPEAQLDRFMFMLKLGYPTAAEELEILHRTTGRARPTPKPVLNAEDLLAMRSVVRDVAVPDGVLNFVVDLVGKTRRDSASPELVRKYVAWGAGPRASQNLVVGAKTRALSLGRLYVTEEDIRFLAEPVLRHRMVLNYAAEADGITPEELIRSILA